MTDWKSAAAPGVRPQPEDEATRQARHEVLATLLGAYADGELPPETMTQVEAHLLGCDRCRREVRVQQELADRLVLLSDTPMHVASVDRVRGQLGAITAAMPAAAPTAPVVGSRRRRALIGAGLLVAALVAGTGWWIRRADAPNGGATPAQLTVAPAIVGVVTADFRATRSRDLPGRARDLDAVRAAVAFPVQPLVHDELRLVGAWTVELDGELAAVLAYRWHDQLLMQYALSDAALFRAADLRRAFGSGQSVALQDGEVGVLAWSATQGGSLLVGDVSWRTLRALRPVER